MGLTMQERHRIIAETARRYRAANKHEKTAILNELVALTGYNRKYALHVLAWWGRSIVRVIDGVPLTLHIGTPKARTPRIGKPTYSKELVQSLTRIWITFDCMCGKRLAVFLRDNCTLLAHCPQFLISEAVCAQLRTISPATIDRLLAPEKQKPWFTTRHRTSPLSSHHYKTVIPVRVCYSPSEHTPGYFEIDTVFHSGSSAIGEFCCTLNATDTMTGWVELRALPNRAQRWVKEALVDIHRTLPFHLIALDSDNGSEFLNRQVYEWCLREHIQFTRSRSYHKNDNPFVEQKNSQYVRRFVGYSRYDTPAEFHALASVYRTLCPLLNFFYPSTRLLQQQRDHQIVHKTYDKPQTPFARLIASPDVPLMVKQRLSEIKANYDPVALRLQLDEALDTLRQQHGMKTQIKIVYR